MAKGEERVGRNGLELCPRVKLPVKSLFSCVLARSLFYAYIAPGIVDIYIDRNYTLKLSCTSVSPLRNPASLRN